MLFLESSISPKNREPRCSGLCCGGTDEARSIPDRLTARSPCPPELGAALRAGVGRSGSRHLNKYLDLLQPIQSKKGDHRDEWKTAKEENMARGAQREEMKKRKRPKAGQGCAIPESLISRSTSLNIVPVLKMQVFHVFLPSSPRPDCTATNDTIVYLTYTLTF